MLKITQIDGPDSARTFTFEGQLREPWVAEVRNACTPPDVKSGPIGLDLSGLTFVDRAGVKLLQELIHRGLAVSACSGFVAALLQLENP